MGLKPEQVAAFRSEYDEYTEAAGKPPGAITAMGGLRLDDRALETLEAFRHSGVDRYVFGARYQSLDEYKRHLDDLAALVGRLD